MQSAWPASISCGWSVGQLLKSLEHANHSQHDFFLPRLPALHCLPACLPALTDGTYLTDPEMLARYTAVYGPPMAPREHLQQLR